MRTALVVVTLLAAPALAQLCPSSPPTTDGCSTQGIEDWVLPVAYYRDVFSTQCAHHDVCYRVLGQSKSSCDDTFFGEMLSRCHDKFAPWDPIGEQLCRDAASQFYAAVVSFGGADHSQMQREGRDRSVNMRNAVSALSCGTTPERTLLYSSSFIANVRSLFASRANRQPTTFEFFEAVHAADPTGDQAVWAAAVQSYASSRTVVPPLVAFAVDKRYEEFTRFSTTVIPLVTNPTNWTWRVNNVLGAGSSFTFTLPPTPKYGVRHVPLQGFLVGTSNTGAREMVVIDDLVTQYGWCNTGSSGPCL
jgi:hypothetical protein